MFTSDSLCDDVQQSLQDGDLPTEYHTHGDSRVKVTSTHVSDHDGQRGDGKSDAQSYFNVVGWHVATVVTLSRIMNDIFTKT